ncbi:MAG: Eco57I restriction-modification methylase domain-containing protein [Chloroflexota bacterium]
MPTETQERIYDLLQRIPRDGLTAAKQLFWTELNYDRTNTPLSRRNWPDRARKALTGEPLLLAQHRSQFGAFDVIYARLAPEYQGRDLALSLTAERLAIHQLLNDHPYALFVFSDPEERRWHLVNVRYEREASRRRVYRRITIGPYERLRTASDRVAMLAVPAPETSALELQSRHDEAFDVEAVTREFFGRFARLFYRIRGEVAALPDLADDADDHTQMLLDRLLFLYFVQKKGWLAQDPDYLYNRFLGGHAVRPESTSFYAQVIYPLFLALSDRETNRELVDTLGVVPFLNGGLFELHLASSGRSAAQARLPVTNATFQALFAELLEHYNFTISEDSPLDQEVAIDPEMLGKIFESLVLEREQDPGVDLRKATGSYYTPRPVVAFMCREALAEHLAGESAVDRARIVRLLELPPAGQLSDEERAWLQDAFSVDEAHSLKALLLSVRACDPAVGSGAFLLGLLQALTWAVGLLDWRLHGDAAPARRNYSFDLKKQVVEHCLYGVDIQAQAVQICELRLWLSLIVDYELPEGQPFDQAVRQVPALPNLAYKVRQGDSLLERLFGQVVSLDEMSRDRETQELVEDLQKEKAAYFSLADTPEKRHRELRILELQTTLAGKLVEAQRAQLGGYQPPLLGEESAQERRQREAYEARLQAFDALNTMVGQARKRLRELRCEGDGRGHSADDLRRQLLGDPQHPTFLWRVDFAEVFQEKGGFDLMMANPPYVRQEKITHLKASLKLVYPDVYHGVADIYVYFYAQGLRQLRDDGTLVYISSNKFMRAGYGQTLRRLLGQQVTLRTVIDFGDLPVFEATTYPGVLVVRNRPPAQEHAAQALTVDDMAVVHHLAEAVRAHAWRQPQASLRPEGWTLVRPAVLALVDKLRRCGTPLGEYVGGKFYRGVTTGLNEAFVIDQATRDRLVAEDPRSGEVLKPWIRGRDIDRWRVDWPGLHVIFARRGVRIESYPAIQRHLTQFRERLMPGRPGGRKPGTYQWYEIQDSTDYYTEFERPKIVYPDIAKTPEFAYDTTRAYGGNTMYILPTDELYLLGILNSVVTGFFYTQISSSIQSDYLRFIATYMGQVPIPAATPAQRTAIESLVGKLLAADGQGAEHRERVEAWERELNTLVYELYGLTEQEVRVIEGASEAP